MSEITDGLMERIDQFRTFSLPGQPISMHMGTSYLVTDLWREVLRLNDALAAAKAEMAESKECLSNLATCEINYRSDHDVRGEGSIDAGRSWDYMRHSGDRARAFLASHPEPKP
jgi:hypothetical protein